MNLRILFIPCTTILFASCTHIYEPALYHQDIAYQPKPTSFDTVKATNYISGGLNYYANSNYNDFLVSGQLNLSRGYVFNNFNLSYGAFGVFGQYQSDEDSKSETNYFSDKYFEVVGGRFSANAFVTSGRTDFRFIGVEVAYSHEFGTFADFRQYLSTQPGYYVNPQRNLLTLGLTTEVIFHNVNNKGFQHGIRGFLGTTFGYNNIYNNPKVSENYFSDITGGGFNIFPKVSYFIKVKNYIGTIEVGNALFLRFGYKF
jgi:hypothetical protein